VAQALAAGDLSRRPALSAPGEVGDLAAAVHRMAEQLTSRLQALEREDMHMHAVIESLQEGVIAVDARRQIVRMNESGRRMLRLPDAVPFPADRLPRDHTLREALAAGLAGKSTEPVEISVNGQSMMLTARALGDGGVVLAVFDLTASRRLEAVRRDFVANVSHELKTPLTVILGFAETLAAGDVPQEEGARFVEAIQSNARRMQQIVDDLLDLSRIESGGWVPNPTLVDLRTVAGEVSAGRLRAALDKGVRLTIEICAGAESAFADVTAIRQVFANLVDNAIRHTNAGGSIAMFSERGERGTTIGVRDTGVGIAPEHLSRIFERFYRADSGRARDAGGTGLGLAIVRHLVEAHRGRVQVTSVVGQGTTVTAFFPDAG
jgi:signal transduction histidine kinase